MDIDDIQKASAAIHGARNNDYDRLAKTFGGVRVIESWLLEDHEIAILCGPAAYTELEKRRFKEK